MRWKNAFAQTDFYFGIQPTPAYEISEAAWGFRSLEKTIMDLRGIVPSRDAAVSLKGKLDSAGKYNYWVEAGNGSGNRPESDKFKRGYFHFQWKPTAKFQLTAYQDIIGRPEIVDPNNAAATLSNNASTTGFFAGYATPDKYSLGFEAFWQRTQNGTKLGTVAPFTVDNKTSAGYSTWGWYSFTPRIGVVGRWDYFDPNTNSAVEGDVRNLFLGSLFIKPIKNVYIMPNVEAESYQKVPGGPSFKTSVTPRITLYYVFL